MRHLKILVMLLSFWLITPLAQANGTVIALTHGFVESIHTDDRGLSILRLRPVGTDTVETKLFWKSNSPSNMREDIFRMAGQYVTVRYDRLGLRLDLVKYVIPFQTTQTAKNFGFRGLTTRKFLDGVTTYYTGQVIKVTRIERNRYEVFYPRTDRPKGPAWRAIRIPGLCQIQMVTTKKGLQYFQTEAEEICKAAEDMLISQQYAGIRIAPRLKAMITNIETVSKATGKPLSPDNIVHPVDGAIKQIRSWFP